MGIRWVIVGALLVGTGCSDAGRSDAFDGGLAPSGSGGANASSGPDGSTGSSASSAAGDADASTSQAESGTTDDADGEESGAPVLLDVGSMPEPKPGGGTDLDPLVYAHTNRELFRIDAETLEVTRIGFFDFSDGINQMTDLALDRDGRMIGISTREVYDVDPVTADATLLVELDRPFNGLSFIPQDETTDILVGTSQDGWLYEIDLDSGTSAQIGMFGDDLVSSGDVVAVQGLTLATTTRTGWTTDRLVNVAANGQASNLRDLGIGRIYGLGFWAGRVFGFAEGGEIVVIDVADGAIEVVAKTEHAWWGAGVTTSAPPTPEG